MRKTDDSCAFEFKNEHAARISGLRTRENGEIGFRVGCKGLGYKVKG